MPDLNEVQYGCHESWSPSHAEDDIAVKGEEDPEQNSGWAA